MKIIFLDIDGVLNCEQTVERQHGVFGIDPELAKIYYDILEQTMAKVVLSSTWRLSKNWRQNLEDCGLNTEAIIDITPHMPRPGGVEACERGREIKTWLIGQKINSNYFVENYAILDDDSDMLPDQPHFKTSWKTGITREIADKVIEHLNKPNY